MLLIAQTIIMKTLVPLFILVILKRVCINVSKIPNVESISLKVLIKGTGVWLQNLHLYSPENFDSYYHESFCLSIQLFLVID